MTTSEQYIGIDIGGTFIKYGIVNAYGQIKGFNKIPTIRMDPEQVLGDLIEIINNLRIAGNTIKVGISLPGIINNQNHPLTSGAIPDLYKLDIAKEIKRATQTQVRLINDANAIALAEKWVGAAKTNQNFVCLPLGTGVGAALFINGQLIKGQHGAAGEFGLNLYDFTTTDQLVYQSVSFQCGVILGLCRIYNQKIGRTQISDWETDVRAIIKIAEAGETAAIDSLEAFYHNVAMLILNVTLAIDPEKILIGGGVSENKTIMRGINRAVKEIMKAYTEASVIGLPNVQSCQLGNTAGIIGAAAQFIKEEESK